MFLRLMIFYMCTEELKGIKFPPVIFMTGTGTDVGKSIATGWLARNLREVGINCITQKMIQTGNVGRSEDIELHRNIMGTVFFEEDEIQLTFPVVLPYPCSPDLAARLEKTEIDFNTITSATEKLIEKYDMVLLEGAGGIMVPLKGDYLTADYIRDHNYPVILVVSGELGSINHALLSLNAIKSYNLSLFGVIYNKFFDQDEVICCDTKEYLRNWIEKNFGDIWWWEMDKL